MAKVAPQAEKIERADDVTPLLMDPLGYARITVLQPNNWRIRAYNGCVCARMIGICLLENIIFKIPEPTVVQPASEAWDAAVEISSAVGNFWCVESSPCEAAGTIVDATFKLCLCFPCCLKDAVTLIYEGQNDHILPKATDLELMTTGPQLNVRETLRISDERSFWNRQLGCKKGSWTVYKDNVVVARVAKKKKRCTCASYYTMTDADGVLLARTKVTPTCAEILNKTCRKFTCQCCCLCHIVDCLRCKCGRAKPALRVFAPTKKEKLDIFDKAKCCKKPKTKVMYPTLYIPGQAGMSDDEDDDEDPKLQDIADNDVADEEDATAVASDLKDKYNKVSKGKLKGQPGQAHKYYIKKPPYCCVGLCREVKTGLCMPDLDFFAEAPDLDFFAEAALDAAERNEKKILAAVAGDFKDKDSTAAWMKDWRRVRHSAFDIQYGENFTAAQKMGALLYVLYDMKKHQF